MPTIALADFGVHGYPTVTVNGYPIEDTERMG
jgi:hypothetical protein